MAWLHPNHQENFYFSSKCGQISSECHLSVSPTFHQGKKDSFHATFQQLVYKSNSTLSGLKKGQKGTQPKPKDMGVYQRGLGVSVLSALGQKPDHSVLEGLLGASPARQPASWHTKIKAFI